MASPVRDLAWLAWIERLVEGAAGSPPAVPLLRSGFHCRLDDQPDHLVPAQYAQLGQWEGSAGRHLGFNANRIFEQGQRPSTVSEEDASGFALNGETLWIEDPGTGALQPFWLGPRLAAILRDLKFGDPLPSGLPISTSRALTAANVLVHATFVSDRRREWLSTVERCRRQFRERGFVPVRGMFHPFHIAALRRYYRYRIRTGQMPFGDSQSPLRYFAYNDSIARYFHHQLTQAVSQLAGESLKASYVYIGAYQPGALLEKHLDREQCEFSLSLCLDYTPEPSGATPWPLVLHTDSGTVSVYQGLGDVLLYRGRRIPHSREPLPPRHTSTSIFFHYVRQDYCGSLQ